MRLVFMATGEIALPAFRRLLAEGPRPLALVTQPDKPQGRHRSPLPPAIKVAAMAAGVPVLQPERVGDAAGELAALAPELIVVMAYGQILRQDVLALPSLATINLHASLLPRHRGASCIQAAILAGDPITGITAMHVAPQLDAGDIILAKTLDIGDGETGGSLHDRLADLAPDVLMETLRQLAAGTAARRPQDESLASYAPKMERDTGRIDWSLPAATIARRMRAFDPWPGSFTRVREGETWHRLKFFPPAAPCDAPLAPREVIAADGALLIGCGSGALRFRELQPEGSRRMSAADYLRGHHPAAVE
jgi:methionyl-tRNA formyltransferase